MRRERAMALFEEGYNCAQSVFLAFSDLHGMDTHTAAALSSSFGGGMGRLREVCGAVSGMFLTAGILYGYDDPAPGRKKRHTMRESRNWRRRLRKKTVRLSVGNCLVYR